MDYFNVTIYNNETFAIYVNVTVNDVTVAENEIILSSENFTVDAVFQGVLENGYLVPKAGLPTIDRDDYKKGQKPENGECCCKIDHLHLRGDYRTARRRASTRSASCSTRTRCTSTVT